MLTNAKVSGTVIYDETGLLLCRSWEVEPLRGTRSFGVINIFLRWVGSFCGGACHRASSASFWCTCTWLMPFAFLPDCDTAWGPPSLQGQQMPGPGACVAQAQNQELISFLYLLPRSSYSVIATENRLKHLEYKIFTQSASTPLKWVYYEKEKNVYLYNKAIWRPHHPPKQAVKLRCLRGNTQTPQISHETQTEWHKNTYKHNLKPWAESLMRQKSDNPLCATIAWIPQCSRAST